MVSDAASAQRAVAHVEALLHAAGIEGFRAAPPVPTSCCGRGCNGCVWEGYFAALGWWQEDAAALLAQQR